MKYIIFKNDTNGLVQPVLFAEHTTHSEVTLNGSTAVSAGFFRIENGEIICYLDSVSLNLSPKDGDDQWIKAAILNMNVSFFLTESDYHGKQR